MGRPVRDRGRRREGSQGVRLVPPGVPVREGKPIDKSTKYGAKLHFPESRATPPAPPPPCGPQTTWGSLEKTTFPPNWTKKINCFLVQGILSASLGFSDTAIFDPIYGSQLRSSMRRNYLKISVYLSSLNVQEVAEKPKYTVRFTEKPKRIKYAKKINVILIHLYFSGREMHVEACENTFCNEKEDIFFITLPFISRPTLPSAPSAAL